MSTADLERRIQEQVERAAYAERLCDQLQERAHASEEAHRGTIKVLRRLYVAQMPTPVRRGESHLSHVDKWQSERNAACEAARALLARMGVTT